MVKILVSSLPERQEDCPFYKHKIIERINDTTALAETGCTLGANYDNQCNGFIPVKGDSRARSNPLHIDYYCNCPYLQVRPVEWPKKL